MIFIWNNGNIIGRNILLMLCSSSLALFIFIMLFHRWLINLIMSFVLCSSFIVLSKVHSDSEDKANFWKEQWIMIAQTMKAYYLFEMKKYNKDYKKRKILQYFTNFLWFVSQSCNIFIYNVKWFLIPYIVCIFFLKFFFLHN